MIRCYHCGTDNLDGSEYCDECGTKLKLASALPHQTSAPPSVTQVAPPPPSFIHDTITPKPATPYTPPPPPPPIIPPPPVVAAAAPPPRAESSRTGTPSSNLELGNAGGRRENKADPFSAGNTAIGQHTTAFNGQTSSLRAGANAEARPAPEYPAAEAQIRAKLIIQRGGKIGKEFPILSADSMIGRWDADGGIFPDVDLDQDDPEAKVSRRHARIQFLNNQFLIEDLGSTNGTFINRGPRLLPGNKQPLSNGDEIIVGKTFLKFVLL